MSGTVRADFESASRTWVQPSAARGPWGAPSATSPRPGTVRRVPGADPKEPAVAHHLALVISTATDPQEAIAELSALAASYGLDADEQIVQYDSWEWDPDCAPAHGAHVADLPDGLADDLVVSATISYADGWRLTGLTDAGTTPEERRRYEDEFRRWLADHADQRAALLRYWF